MGISIVGAYETAYTRHSEGAVTTQDLLANCVSSVAAEAGIPLASVDGLGVSSFTLHPDHAIDFAWRMGLRLRWIMQDPHGGVSGINLLQHAIRAIEYGDAETIILVSGDALNRGSFNEVVTNYNEATRDYLAPLPYAGPNPLFAMLTSRHMKSTGLAPKDYGEIPVNQRRWASQNPGAVYRSPMSIDDYLSAPLVFSPLRRFDCVPVVSGADAIIVTRRQRQPGVVIRSIAGVYNYDDQEGDGLGTGHSKIREALWNAAGVGPSDVDLASVYDDYPVMVIEQLADLGLIPDTDYIGYLHRQLGERRWPLNTSGGQLSCGQAGSAGGMHFLVEAVTQLLGRARGRQVEGARLGLVTGYGMVLYRYGACANAAILEAVS